MAKKKQEDFKKVKIRAGKRIPKHLNETKPEFKAKKIHVKPFANSATSDLVKLLSSASLNTNLKIVYLGKLNQQLLESVQSSQGGEQIQAVCKYITDDDSRVREHAITCLKTCFKAISNKSSSETLSPLLSILLTFVNCGITHINDGIRKDSQKLFAFLLDKCDSSLENHLMQMFLAKINALWRKSLDADYYCLLDKFVSKSISKKYAFKPDCPTSADQSAPTPDGIILKWSPTNCTIPLHDAQNIARRFSNIQDFQLTFQNKSHANIQEKFIESVQVMAVKDSKSLLGKESNRSLSIGEGQKALSALKIALALNVQGELLEFWKRNAKLIPLVKIVNPASSKNSISKADVKKFATVQNEINFCLNRFRKLLK